MHLSFASVAGPDWKKLNINLAIANQVVFFNLINVDLKISSALGSQTGLGFA